MNVESGMPAASPYVSPYLRLPRRTLDDVLRHRTKPTGVDYARRTIDEGEEEKPDSTDARR
jgi:hypothetical protein